MAIVCLLGSPRPGGNSDFLARQVCEAAEAQGAEIWPFRLNSLEFWAKPRAYRHEAFRWLRNNKQCHCTVYLP